MKPYILFSPGKQELAALNAVMNFLMKKRGSVQIPQLIQKLDQLKLCLEDPGQIKMLVCDVTTEGVLPLVEQLRSGNPEMKLVLVADNSVPPVRYIRPGILPTALLWRPLQPEQTRDTLWEVLLSIPTAQAGEEKEDDAFTVEVRGDVRRIPYRDILFFEAGNKRLTLHQQRREIPFAGTLEKLTEELPEEFVRVHKSFIVNRSAIIQIQFGQNLIFLEGGMTVPISRSYKPALKAVFS